MLWSVRHLHRAPVVAREGRTVGHVHELHLDPRRWDVESVVIVAGHGLVRHRVAVSLDAVAGLTADRRVALTLTRAELLWRAGPQACGSRDLIGCTAMTADGYRAGCVHDLLVDPIAGTVEHLVLRLTPREAPPRGPFAGRFASLPVEPFIRSLFLSFARPLLRTFVRLPPLAVRRIDRCRDELTLHLDAHELAQAPEVRLGARAAGSGTGSTPGGVRALS